VPLWCPYFQTPISSSSLIQLVLVCRTTQVIFSSSKYFSNIAFIFMFLDMELKIIPVTISPAYWCKLITSMSDIKWGPLKGNISWSTEVSTKWDFSGTWVNCLPDVISSFYSENESLISRASVWESLFLILLKVYLIFVSNYSICHSNSSASTLASFDLTCQTRLNWVNSSTFHLFVVVIEQETACSNSLVSS